MGGLERSQKPQQNAVLEGENTQQPTDLTSAENVQRGQEIYDRITSGQCQDVTAELDAAYGRESERD